MVSLVEGRLTSPIRRRYSRRRRRERTLYVVIRTFSGTRVGLLLVAEALEIKIVRLLLLDNKWSIVFVVGGLLHGSVDAHFARLSPTAEGAMRESSLQVMPAPLATCQMALLC